LGDNPFDIFGSGKSTFDTIAKGARVGVKVSREMQARRVYAEVARELGEDAAQMAAEAVRAGQSPQAVIARARKAQEEKRDRDAKLASPPPLFGSARFATRQELAPVLRDRADFDTPSSILLGAYEDPDEPERPAFVHWDDAGHLMTLAPTRAGKATTVIIPNLLRYRGSVVVFDPKGELYAATSKWRRENVGPVYRLAPFDDGGDPETAGYVRNRFNPLAHVHGAREARGLATLLFPRDPRSPEFFSDDAISFVTAVIMYVLEAAPPERQTLAEVRRFLLEPEDKLRRLVEDMRFSSHELVVEAANNVLGKSRDRGLPNLRDTLQSKFAMWSDERIIENVSGSDFDFADLKSGRATVYVEMPLEALEAYGPWVRVVLMSALDAMLRTRAQPDISVLFVLDEFLALGPFEEFRNAIRTHAGAGVRLWFFLQDLGSLELYYPNGGWKPFLNCAVKQYFGTNDFGTAELISRDLGQKTVAYLSQSTGDSASSHGGDWTRESQGANVGMSRGESVQYAPRALMQPDEVKELLSGWLGKGTRRAILDLSNVRRPFKTFLADYELSATCRERVGVLKRAT
jgi:type IV secretion system protein VirD4